MKRWDLVAFFALALVPPAALTVMAGMRATRIPPLVASLPARIEERLGPVARRSHWPGDGVFGARAFDDLQALAVDRASPDATSVLKQALLDGTRPPDEYVALERAHRQRLEGLILSAEADAFGFNKRPPLDESPASGRKLTTREKVERHRSNPACASCHSRIDGLGFALENFDVIGRWRTRDRRWASRGRCTVTCRARWARIRS